ncbi:MAG: hypothetical protein A2283_20565 [Lentisphaerae bacterium RIFOXYA12_FULL_48_11]|nr:MAG: hypothetical protein A2283_20565 [Lentisphaerae bacterium RIFOXYA12_FULL_48_11]
MTLQKTNGWEVVDGEDGIQPNTPEFHSLVEKIGKSMRDFDKFLAVKEDLASLSSLERKMDSIIIPEVDIRCGDIRDVIEMFNKMSVEFDKSSPSSGERGVKIVLKQPKESNELHLVHYHAENASLLKHLQLSTWLGRCQYTITNGVVELRFKEQPKEGDPFVRDAESSKPSKR